MKIHSTAVDRNEKEPRLLFNMLIESSPLDSPFGIPHGGGVLMLSRKSRFKSRAGGKVSET
jgi:hypothetical protein